MALLPELETRSVLDVVEENFQRVGLKTYAMRFMYASNHRLPKPDVIRLVKRTVTDVNSSYCDINLTGLLLVYDGYFIHILEGSEDTIFRHLRFLFNKEAEQIADMVKEDNEVGTEGLATMEEERVDTDHSIFRRAKLLMAYHSISTRYFDKWHVLQALPPTLITKLDIYTPLATHMDQLKICIEKLHTLADFLNAEENLKFDGLAATDPRVTALPEVGLLDFLLSSQYLHDLRKVSHSHRRISDYTFYSERVWPLPCHFTPRLLYKLKVDDSFVEPLPVMPWELVKKETTEDEEREERESASDSDD